MNRARAVLLLLLLGLALGGCGRKTALTLPPAHSVTPAAPTAPVQSPAAHVGGNVRDTPEFGRGFHIEAEDSGVEGGADFDAGLADAGKNDFAAILRARARLQREAL